MRYTFRRKSENSRKIFKISKIAKFVSKSVQTCFGAIFSTIFYPVFHGSSSLQKCCKNQNFFKITKLRKIVPKSVQTCFGAIFSSIFLSSVPWKVESSKMFQKSKNFQNYKNAQNRSQKWPKVFPTCFGGFFEQKALPRVAWLV